MSAYVGSRSGEIETMLANILTSTPDARTYAPRPSAGTDSLEAERRQCLAACQVRPGAALAGDDLDTVEHIRQNRLRRWHAQP